MSMNRYRIMVVGDPGVGKSALISQMAEKTFIESYEATRGYEDTPQPISIDIDGILAVVELVDTPGIDLKALSFDTPADWERHRQVKGTHAIVFMYSITCRISFQSLDYAKTLFLQPLDFDAIRVPMILVGNKADLEDRRMVGFSEGISLAQTWGMVFWEASVRLNQNVHEIVEELVRQIRAEEELKYIPPSSKRIVKCSII